MRMYRVLLAATCVAAASGVAWAQTASTQVPRTGSGAGAFNFSYDAQHDRMTADGLRFMAVTKNGGIMPTTGTIMVTINITPVTHFKKNTEFHCTLLAVGGLIDTTNAVIAGGLETANGEAKAGPSGSEVCTLTIPYSWTIPPDPAGATGLILAVGVSAVGGGNEGPEEHGDGGGTVIRSTLQAGGVLPLPANGSTTTEMFDVVL